MMTRKLTSSVCLVGAFMGLLVALVARAAEDSQVCLEKAAQMDKCLPKLVVYGDRKFEPPRSENQLDDHCVLLDDNLKCVSSYSRECLPAFARSLYSVITKRLKSQFTKRCKTKDGRRDFLDMMACADPEHLEPAHKCMDSFVSHLEQIDSNGGQNKGIELTCCSFQLFQECIFSVSKRMSCAARVHSAEKSIDYVRSIINSMGGDVMEFMCGKYDKVSNCIAGHPNEMANFKLLSQKVLNGTHKPQSGSPIKPMLKLFLANQDQSD